MRPLTLGVMRVGLLRGSSAAAAAVAPHFCCCLVGLFAASVSRPGYLDALSVKAHARQELLQSPRSLTPQKPAHVRY